MDQGHHSWSPATLPLRDGADLETSSWTWGSPTCSGRSLNIPVLSLLEPNQGQNTSPLA